MKTRHHSTSAYFFGFIIIVALLLLAFYIEKIQGVAPCPLCILQRICLGALGALFLFGSVVNVNRLGQVVLAGFSFIFSIAGVLLSGRQVWLQHHPVGISGNCDVSLSYMMQVMPLDQVIKNVFQGGAECSQVNWALFGLSLADWSFILFIFFALFSIRQLLRG